MHKLAEPLVVSMIHPFRQAWVMLNNFGTPQVLQIPDISLLSYSGKLPWIDYREKCFMSLALPPAPRPGLNPIAPAYS
jgi:hypothetical protein